MPSILNVPPVGLSSPAMIRSRVVLPEPEGPSSATSSPESICSDMPSRAVKLPKVLMISFT